MTGGFGRAVVADMVVVRGDRGLEQAPGLVDANHADEVRAERVAAEVVRAVGAAEDAGGATCRRVFQMLVWKTCVLILRRERGRDALAEIGRCR